MAQDLRLVLRISTEGAAKTVGDLRKIQSAAAAAGEGGAEAFGQTAEQIARAEEQMQALQKAIDLDADQVVVVTDAFESLLATGESFASAQKKIAEQFGLTIQQAEQVAVSVGKIKGSGLDQSRNSAAGFLGNLIKIGLAIGGVVAALQLLKRFAPDSYAALIAKSEEYLGKLKQIPATTRQAFDAAKQTLAAKLPAGGDVKAIQKQPQPRSFKENLGTIKETAATAAQIAGTATTALRLVSVLQKVAGAAGQAQGAVAGIGGANAGGGGIAELAFRFNNVVAAVQTLAASAKPAYDLLIGANERLNAQILQTQTNLASSSRIFQGGIEVEDTTEKIKATEAATKAALKQIEADTQSLVGVTSAQVNELFSITITNAAALNKQSQQFPDPIQAATSLTKGWAASLKVLNIPLDQARQEINSILKGQVDQNSILAKSLNITNQQVTQWQGQGRLVDELNKKLEVFVAGNAIAARSIDGISSNIKDLGERVARNAGEPLLEPTIEALAQLEVFLKANEQAITQFFRFFAEGGVQAGGAIAQNLQPAVEGLIEFADEGGKLAQGLFGILSTGLNTTSALLGPLLGDLLTFLAKAAEGLALVSEAVQLNQINDAVDALVIYQSASAAISDEALRTASSLKALSAEQQKNGALSDEQAKTQGRLRQQAKLQVAAIDEQITALKDLNAVSPDVQRQRDVEIASLEKLQATLARSSGSIEIQGKTLEDLGTSYKQLQSSAENAQRVIASQGQGDSAQFANSIKSLIDITEQQVELGQVTSAEAESRLAAIAANTKVEVDLQQAAQTAIGKIRKAELDKQVSDIQSQIAKVEASEKTGGLGPVAAAQEVTRLKRKELDIQLADVQRSITTEKAAINQGRGSKTNLGSLQNQQAELQAKLAQESIAAEERSQQARLAVVEKASEKRLAIAGLVEAKANAESAKLQRQGAITSEQAEQQKLAASQARITAELEAERSKLQVLEGLGKQTNPQAEADRQSKILAGQTKLVELQSSLEESRAKSAEVAYAAVAASADRANQRIVQAEVAREVQLQGLINKGIVTAEQADARKLKSAADRIKAELALESKRIQDIGSSGLDPEAKEKLRREAQSRTAQLTLQLLQNQAQQEEQVRSRILASIEDQASAQQRAYDVQISALADVSAARSRAVSTAEAAAQREIAAIESAGSALQRQNELLSERANLQQATSGLAQTQTSIQLEQTKRAAEIQAQLASGEQISDRERLVLKRELNTLGVDTSKSAIDLLKQQQALEDQLAQQQQAGLLQEQAQAQAQLTIENQRNQLAANRAVIEAKINELKAKAAVLDAQAAIREQQLQAQRQIAAAQSNLKQAQQQAPGRDRDRAVAAASAEVAAAQSTAQRDAAAAQQSLLLAQQQATLSKQATTEAAASKAQQAEVSKIASETLIIQQQQSLAQQQATELARGNAQALALAKAESEAIAAAAEREAAARERSAAAAQKGGGTPTNLPGRYMGGSVQSGRAYIVGEREAEVFVPGVSGTVLNQAQIARNLRALQAAQSAAYGRVLNSVAPRTAVSSVDYGHGQQKISQHIDARVSNTFVNSAEPIRDAAQYALQAQRDILARGRLR